MKTRCSPRLLLARTALAACAAAAGLQTWQVPGAYGVTITVNSGSVFTVGAQNGSTLSGFSGFTQNGTATINPAQTQVLLTTNVNDQAGSAWTSTPQTLTNSDGFTVNFTYTASGDRAADGATFAIQNDPAGAAALGTAGGGLGYGQINSSMAYEINLFPVAGGIGTVVNVNGTTGQFNGGALYNTTLPAVDFTSGDPIAVTLNYANGKLAESLIDTVTGGVYAYGYSVDLNAVLGGTSGRMGFTGGTGGLASTQTISDFSVALGPGNNQSVSADALVVNAGGSLVGTSGSLNVPTWTINGGAVALSDIAVNFTDFTQSGGYVALGDINIDSGDTYTITAGTNVLASVNVLPGGSFTLSAGTFSTASISNAGAFSWTGGTIKITDPVGITLDHSTLGTQVALTGGMSLLVSNNTTIPVGSTLTLNGGTFSTKTLAVAGLLNLQTGNFFLTGQDLTIANAGTLGPTIFIGPNMNVQVNMNTVLADEGRLVVSGGAYTSDTVTNNGTVSVTDGQFTVADASTNNAIFDAIRSFITFGTGAGFLMDNFGTLNLIDTNVYGDLHNESGALLRTAGNVVFFGNLTSAGAALAANGSVQLFGAANALAGVSGTGSLTVEAGANATLDAVSLASLTINGAASIRANGASTSKISALTLAGSSSNWSGLLDITNNKLIVEDAITHATTLATLQNQANYGRTHNGGIISSVLPANMAVAVIDNGALASPLATFGGLPADASSIFVAPELLGDANIDGVVNFADFVVLSNHFGASGGGWVGADFNGDGVTNFSDFVVLSNNFGAVIGSGFSPQLVAGASLDGSAASGVPEPAALALLGLPALLPLLRRQAAPRAR